VGWQRGEEVPASGLQKGLILLSGELHLILCHAEGKVRGARSLHMGAGSHIRGGLLGAWPIKAVNLRLPHGWIRRHQQHHMAACLVADVRPPATTYVPASDFCTPSPVHHIGNGDSWDCMHGWLPTLEEMVHAPKPALLGSDDVAGAKE
jgi:hypothetical protein